MSSDTPLQSTVASSEHKILSVLGQKPVITQFPGVKKSKLTEFAITL